MARATIGPKPAIVRIQPLTLKAGYQHISLDFKLSFGDVTTFILSPCSLFLEIF